MAYIQPGENFRHAIGACFPNGIAKLGKNPCYLRELLTLMQLLRPSETLLSQDLLKLLGSYVRNPNY